MNTKTKIEGYLQGAELDFVEKSFNVYLKENVQGKYGNSNICEYESPSIISNAIIEMNTYSGGLKFRHILFLLERLFCKHSVLKLNSSISLDELKEILHSLNEFNVHELLILADYADDMYSEEFAEIVLTSNRFKGIIFFNSPFDKNLSNLIYYLKRNRTGKTGQKKSSFFVNWQMLSESQNHHTYFNRKLYIGPNGEIKNAPEFGESFGCIQDLDTAEQLKGIVQTPAFQKYWYVHKEITDVCKDCEFRHMCVDNRLPYQRPENQWYHKQECNYNPYIAKWKHEEGYCTLAECGVTSNENGFTIDHEKIAKINEELWGE